MTGLWCAAAAAAAAMQMFYNLENFQALIVQDVKDAAPITLCMLN